MKLYFAWVWVGLWASLACAQTGSPTALVNATLWTAEGPPQEGVTIVIEGDEVQAVGRNVSIPSNARRVDCGGTVVTSGFFSTGSALGMVEIDLEASTVDQAPQGEGADPLRASFSAVDAYHPLSTLIPVARRHGVTTVMSTPQGGLIAGTSAWFDLAGTTPQASLVEEFAALHVNISDGGIEASGGARPALWLRLRAAFDDARLFRQRRAQFERRQLRDLSLSRTDLERLVAALEGDLPVVVRVARSSDILRAIEFGRAYDLRLVLAGAEEGWMVAEQIADAEIPVMMRPLTNLPGRFSRLHARFDNAARMSAAGVSLIMTAGGAHDQRNLRQEAGNAVARGLARQVALQALTSVPAETFGIDERYGHVRPGAVANLVVWTGDPFEVTSWARHVWVRGQEVSTQTRQTLLFERYRDLSQIPRGQRGLPRVQSGPQQ